MSARVDLIRKWIGQADQDLGTAELTQTHIPDYRETIAFHCQQAVEKYLKAYLIFLDISFKRSHYLVYLLGLISTKVTVTDLMYDNASELEDFSVEIRYPDTKVILTDEDIRRAIQITHEFRVYVLGKMKLEDSESL